MPMSEAIRAKLDELDAEVAVETRAAEEKAAGDMRQRLRAVGVAPAELPGPRVASGIVPEEPAAIRAGIEDPEYYADVVRNIKSDRNFAVALALDLAALGHAPRPKWFSVIDFFSALVDFGDAGKATICVASAGSRMKILLSTRLMEMQRELDKLNERAGQHTDEKEVPVELVTERNRKIEELATLQECDVYGATITKWEGPIFSWPNPTNGVLEAMPLLNSFDLNNSEQALRAAAVYRRIPRKAFEMINHARKILDTVGIEDGFSKGNL